MPQTLSWIGCTAFRTKTQTCFFFLLGLGTQMFWKQWDSCYWKIMQSFITMATLGIIFVVKDHVTSQASSSLKRYLNYSEMKFGTK